MSETKSQKRWDFRIPNEVDGLVREALAATHRSLTDFVVTAVTMEAERVLADRTRFVLDAERWERFSELLERPPQENPGLEALFAKPSVFESSRERSAQAA
jgi:uncharacterized protein (DUF1778 family)